MIYEGPNQTQPRMCSNAKETKETKQVDWSQLHKSISWSRMCHVSVRVQVADIGSRRAGGPRPPTSFAGDWCEKRVLGWTGRVSSNGFGQHVGPCCLQDSEDHMSQNVQQKPSLVLGSPAKNSPLQYGVNKTSRFGGFSTSSTIYRQTSKCWLENPIKHHTTISATLQSANSKWHVLAVWSLQCLHKGLETSN